MFGCSTTHCCTTGSRRGGYCVAIHDKSILGKSSRKLVVKGRVFNNRVLEGDKKAVRFHLSQSIPSKKTCQLVLEKSSELRRIVNMFPKRCSKVVPIKVLSPDMVCMDKSSRWLKKEIGRKLDDEWVTVEERLGPDFIEFVDSQGHVTSQTTNVDLMKELVHYSYIASDGEMVVCGLQGVSDGNNFHLSEPTIHSMSRRYGDSDGGEAGIISVFSNHTCTDTCRQWSRPPRNSDVPDSRLAQPLRDTLSKQQLVLLMLHLYQDTVKCRICDNQDSVLQSQSVTFLVINCIGDPIKCSMILR